MSGLCQDSWRATTRRACTSGTTHLHGAGRCSHAVGHAGWEFGYVDGWTIEDKETFLDAVGGSVFTFEERLQAELRLR